MREIGGDFEITWPGTVYQPMVDASWYDELGGLPLYWYSSGRMGLRAILRSIPKGTFLVPSYLCASILWAFRQEGVSVKFYSVTPDLQGDVAEITTLLSSCADVAGMFHIDLFGVVPTGALSNLFAEMVSKGLCVIEDITHSFPGTSNLYQRTGSHVLCSVRKTLPFPDGAFVLSRILRPIEAHIEAAPYVQAKLQAQMEKSHYLRAGTNRDFLRDLRRAEAGFDLDYEIRRISRVSRTLLRRVDLREVRVRRRKNFEYLLSKFESSMIPTVARPLVRELSKCSSPLGFPVWSKWRNELQHHLIHSGVFPPIHWVLPPEAREWALSHNQFSFNLSESELTIPCDQRYGEGDMDYIVAQVVRFAETHG